MTNKRNQKLFECVVEARSTLLVAANSIEEAEKIALDLVHSGTYTVVPDSDWELADETQEVEG